MHIHSNVHLQASLLGSINNRVREANSQANNNSDRLRNAVTTLAFQGPWLSHPDGLACSSQRLSRPASSSKV